MPYENIFPSAPGDLTEIESQTPDSGEHWDKVVLSDGDTKKVHTTTDTWERDLYRVAATDLIGPITYVRIYITGKGLAPVSGSKGEGLIKTYGTLYPSGSVPAFDSTYRSYYKTWNTNPHTGEAWTWSELTDENFQIGVRLFASREYGIYETALTAVRVRVSWEPVIATVTTQAVTEIAGTTATGNGNLINSGGDFVYQHGHCWSTSHNPTTSDSKTENGSKAAPGAFTSSITDLISGTLYYCRAYATNYVGTAYGDEVEFIAGTSAPSVSTNPAAEVGQTTATLNSHLDDDGNEACDCSFEYGETTDYGTETPTQSKTTCETFSQEVLGLKGGTVYHFRAKATNSAGTSYGADRTFHTEALSAEAHEALGRHFSMGRHGL